MRRWRWKSFRRGNWISGRRRRWTVSGRSRETATGQEFRERMKAHIRPIADDATASELAAALRQSVADRCAQLAARPAEFFEEMMTRHFDLQRLTRMEMLQFVKEHELTHRSQLFMYLRLKGVVPATTRRRLAKQAAK